MARARDLMLRTMLGAAAVVMTTAAALAETTAVETHGTDMIEVGVKQAEHGGGMPQLDALTYPSQIFWLIVTFGLLYWLLKNRALPRVGEVLEARQDRIADDLDKAAVLRGEAEKAIQDYEAVVASATAKAQAQVTEVRDRVAAEAAVRQAELDKDLATQIGEAEARIRGGRDAALGEINAVAADVARSATERLIGVKIDAAKAKAAVKAVMQEAA